MTKKRKAKVKPHDFDGLKVVIYREKKPPGDWVAFLHDVPQVSAYGPTLLKTTIELGLCWDLYKQSCDAQGAPIPKLNET